MVSFYAWVAEQESRRRSERAKAAVERRRRAGLPVGRQARATPADRGRAAKHARIATAGSR